MAVLSMVVLTWMGRDLGTWPVQLGPFVLCVDGVVAFELAGDVESADKLLTSWGEAQLIVLGFSLGFDFLFILAYGTLMTLACLWASDVLDGGSRWRSRLGWSIVVMQVGAAICDIAENGALMKQLLSDPVSPWPEIAFWCASVKFCALLLGLAYISLAGIIWLCKVSRR